MERAKRIELSSQPWQGRVLPLNHARKNQFTFNTKIITNFRVNVQLYFLRLVFFAFLFTCFSIGFSTGATGAIRVGFNN